MTWTNVYRILWRHVILRVKKLIEYWLQYQQHGRENCCEIYVNSSPLVLHVWNRMYASVSWVIFGSGNGLLPVLHQAITCINSVLLSTELRGTNFSDIWIGILPFSFKKIHLNVSSAKLVILSGGDELKYSIFFQNISNGISWICCLPLVAMFVHTQKWMCRVQWLKRCCK